MKKLYFLIIPLLLTTHLGAQEITPISNEEFNRASFKSLSFLKEELNDVKIIGLGEALHQMGGTYTAKVKMVKFLHQTCGFDVIAFESPLYSLSYLNKLLESGEQITAQELAENYISGVWNTTEMLELFNYIIQTYKTDRPLEIVGFDESFFPSRGIDSLSLDYKMFSERLSEKSGKQLSINTGFFDAIQKTADKSFYFSKIDPADTLLMHNNFKVIRSSLNESDYQNDQYLHFWKIITDNLESVYRKNYKRGSREERMAANVKYLSDIEYPEKKLILWGASAHLIPNPDAIKEYRETEKYNKRKVGVYLKEELQDQYYFMAFTPLEGQSGFRGYLGIGKTKVRSKKGSLENYINKEYNADFAYVPLRSETVAEELNKNDVTKSNLIWLKGLWYNGEEMDVTEVADGIFYLRKEHLIDSK